MEEKVSIRLCLGSSCFTRGNEDILHVMKKYIEENELEDKVDFRGHLCKGNCKNGPNLSINNKKYQSISESSIELILQEALKPILQ